MMRLILPPMMRLVSLASLAALAVATAVTLAAQPRLTIDYGAMARTIVERLSLAPGERVIAVAHPGTFADLIPHLRYEVMKAGGIDLGVVDVLQEPVPASFDAAVLQRGARESRAGYKAMFRDLATQHGAIYYSSFLAGMGQGRSIREIMRLMQSDGLHPNAEGVQAIVDHIGPKVLELVAEARGR